MTPWRRMLAWAGARIIRVLGRTLRFRADGTYVPGSDPGGPTLLAFDHGRQFPLLAWFNRIHSKRIVLMSSPSRDGRLQAQILGQLGYRVVTGSSSKRAAAGLVEMLRAVRDEGFDAALAVDGPRGPLGSVKPGIAYLAAKTGGTILPVSAAASPRHIFTRSWCGYQLPWPFAAGRIAFGRPVRVEAGADREALDTACQQVRRELNRLEQICETPEAPIRAHGSSAVT